ncbi:RHS repeat-associated core domain-containing protein [Clostridium taeniosporum]|uniref:Uncharacterized protein n=1 Tax=Clostridium taeniosporum TaxID=394958 RepID=A0A1D7XJS1_9CLOT|nr:RHS repeat-associated core domain-containing protein [Clostridium taeniosporum]AOR23440.1 hypothetical protein BGI42_06670 [Clostridium taeniosporum]
MEFNDFDTSDTFTVSLWLKPDKNTDGQCFLGKHTDDGNNIFLMGFWDNGYEVNIRDKSYSSNGADAKTEDYQHLVAVIKKVDDTKSHVTVYKNNEELWNTDINGVIGSTKGKGWTLGQDWDGSSVTDLFKGEIDELAIYNRDLTVDEVGYLYNNKSTINNSYDSIGRLEQKSINSGVNSFVTNYSYLDGINGATTTKIESIDNNGKSIAYTYDPNGNIETITENNKKITYSYNELNELIREDNQVLNKTIVYSYDDGGNFESKVEYPYTDPLTTPLGATNTVNYTYGDTNWKDKLTNFNGKEITYDAIGNPLTYDEYTYSWEWGRQLASMTGNGNTISYKYNDSGIRTQKTVNDITTNYHLVGDKVTYEDNGIDKIYYTYDASGQLVSMNITSSETSDINGEYYYIRNAQGDIIGLFDGTETQIASYSYDSWGKLISIKDGSGVDITNDTESIGYKNPYRYRGYRYDTETGLYYLQSRYYNPEWGRFINADSEGGTVGELLSHNVFAYCGNNPVNRLDPDGRAWWIIGAVAGAVVGGIAGAAYSYYTTGSVDWRYVAGALVGAGLGYLAETAYVGITTSAAAASAVQYGQQRVSELKNGLSNSQISKLPRATSTAVSRVTGKVYQAESGTISETIHPLLKSRIPNPSLTMRPPANCAEFNAVNKALLDGAKIKDLSVATFKIREGTAFPMCPNCRVTIFGANVVTN